MEGQVKSATYLTSIRFPLGSQEDDVFAVAGLCSTDALQQSILMGIRQVLRESARGAQKASLQCRHP